MKLVSDKYTLVYNYETSFISIVRGSKMVEDYSQENIGQDEEEQAEDSFERQQDMMEDVSPAYTSKEDLWGLFKWVVAKKDSSKLGNLNKQELGLLNMSLRDCQELALLGNTFGHQGWANFFMFKGEITSATSVSRDGFQQKLFVTQEKVKSKRDSNLPQLSELPQQQKKKRKFF